MNIDFPLILTILVAGSGLIWLLDAMFLAPGRRRMVAELVQQYPNHADPGHPQAAQFQARVADGASEPILVEYARSFFPVLLLIYVLRSFIVEPFQIPSSSMVPTLEVGDYILVNKFTYGIRLPVVRTKVIDVSEPRHGDVMVFFPPHQNETYYIKRVIGVPGDLVEYRDKILYVNGEQVSREEVAVVPGPYMRLRLGIEEHGDARYTMQVNDASPALDFSVVVKPGHYFMMGDNRDNSSDSRVWGQVPEEDIVGRAFAIWMHWESFLSVPSFSRVGLIE
ncbi:signal peptidase I [Mangrovimicrobium sediminis]|uniref:Signal peptidase I n=1 Tax=Mangrovimicrobium sediminis TaxID=2562682 RepID=A0A4Z0M6H4_9GAMM|nr:signal peptidase I [Haliea sp. SAOS-164]TGD74915.1 signal peptidase I [Haliea sp. SAOS-164]